MRTITVKNKQASLSDSGWYLIMGNDPLHLYVHPQADKPHYCTVELESLQYNGVKYSRYQPVRRFLRDCLHTAEEIIFDEQLELGQDRSHVDGELFGKSDAANIRIANAKRGAANADGQANPDYKEAYAIVSTVLGSPYPYHAAAVVAIDGDDTVTLEVFARAADAQQRDRNAPGRFEMYSKAGNTRFHVVWSADENFVGTNPVTMVIGRFY